MTSLRNFNLRDRGAELWEKWNRPQRTVFVLFTIGVVALLPFAGNFSITSILNTPTSSYQAVLVYPVGMYILMALGLNIVVGKSGLLDLGYVAFFAIGAYSAAILGFGEIVRITAINIQSTGGPNGIGGVPNPPSVLGMKFNIDNLKGFFWIVLVMILLVIWMIRRFTSRRPGRAWEAIRQDEDVAMLMGVPVLRYKIWSFSIGAAVGGAAGVIFASKAMFVAPDMFTFNVSVLILSCVVFGGMGNIWGVIVGATILAYLPERIRFISTARQLVFGLALVIIMNVRPDGLLPRKKREKIKAKGASN